jgi:Tol biopolymer transport system component
MKADGNDQELLFEMKKEPVEPPSWAPDSSYLVFIDGKGSQAEIVLGRPEESFEILDLDSGNYSSISWSPDSKAFIYIETKSDDTYVLHLFIFLEDTYYSVDTEIPFDMAVWSPVAELPE